MAQAAASHLRRLLSSRPESSAAGTSTNASELPSINSSTINGAGIVSQHRPPIRIDRRCIEKVWKQMDRIVKYCQMPKMNLKNSPPYMLDILPDLYQTLREIMTNYEDRLHILNEIDYFRIFIDNLTEQCIKTIDCFKRAGHHMYEENSSYRKYLIKLSLYFSHNLAELKSLFNRGIYEGEKFRLTKQEAQEFWRNQFNERTIVPWEEFIEKLSLVHPIQTINEATALQNTIDLTNNNHVSIFEFDVFTRLFHPWSSLLTNWKLLAVTHPGFMAFMTYDEVKAILANYIDKPGSYVFRLSCTRLGQWAIGYVTSQNTILQTIPQTKPLIQSLIDGEREGYYKYPNGRTVHIDLSSALRPTESDRIFISEEQYAIYCDMGTSFELCKICSVNNKDCKIQPCGHLLCRSCLLAWQNQTSSKPLPLCPFCRGEIKGFESVVISPFESVTHSQQKKESSPNGSNEFDDQTLDSYPNVQTLQSLAIARPVSDQKPIPINSGNATAGTPSESRSATPPPIPPRPVNARSSSNRLAADTNTRSVTTNGRTLPNTPPPLPSILPAQETLPEFHRTSTKTSRPVSLASSNESLNDRLVSTNHHSSEFVSSRSSTAAVNGGHNLDVSTNRASGSTVDDVASNSIESFPTIEDVRQRLLVECSIDCSRIDALLILTQDLPLIKQYELSKLILAQIQSELTLHQNHTFVNGSFINEFD